MAGAGADAAPAADSRPPRYSIVSPTYNEAENVPLLVSMVHEVCGAAKLDYEIVIVDDNSPDGTADVSAGFVCMYMRACVCMV